MTPEFIKVVIRGVELRAPLDDVLTEGFDRTFRTYYNRVETSLLSQLCDTHGTDKGQLVRGDRTHNWHAHTYADYLERTFRHCRHHIRNVFECGMGTNNPALVSSMGSGGRPGASLRVWRDYFPNAQIVGVDIDGEILFQEDRIRTFQCDQTDPAAIKAVMDQLGEVEFDLMIDDGLHTFAGGVCLLENAIHKLRPEGLYIIEDVNILDLFNFMIYFKDKPWDVEFVNLYRKDIPLADNSLIVIRKG